MEPGRSLREVRKQYKERALAAAKVSTATPQPSPPISEADFQSSASVNAFNDAQSVTEYQEEVKEDTEKKFSEWLQQSVFLFLMPSASIFSARVHVASKDIQTTDL